MEETVISLVRMIASMDLTTFGKKYGRVVAGTPNTQAFPLDPWKGGLNSGSKERGI